VSAPGFVDTRRREVAEARAVLRGELEEAGIRTHPSHANFVLVELGVDDGPVCQALLRRGVLIRGGHEFGLPGFARVTVAPPAVMQRAAAEIIEAVAGTL
jgi:histidinol-phosphate aminotransferase